MSQITVKLGKLTEQIKTSRISQSTTLGQFLLHRKLTFGPKVRVNGKTKTRGYILQNGDLVTYIPGLDGGR